MLPRAKAFSCPFWLKCPFPMWDNGQEWRGISNSLSCLMYQKQFQDAESTQFLLPQGSRNSGVRSKEEEATGMRVGERSSTQTWDRGVAHVWKPRHSVRTGAEKQRCMSGLLPTQLQAEPCIPSSMLIYPFRVVQCTTLYTAVQGGPQWVSQWRLTEEQTSIP